MHLILDLPFNESTHALSRNRTLAQLLGLASRKQLPMPLEALVASSFGLQATPDFPLAAVSASADQIEVGEYYWLRAAPVHLVMQRDCFSLNEPVPLLLSEDEANALVATLNAHFVQDGLTFMRGSSGAWYLKTADIQAIQTALPDIAIGKNVHDFMPTGLDAAKWRAVLNSIQMLLHDHPINALREQQKLPAVNSVWLSGGGVMQHNVVCHVPYQTILATNSLCAGLAALTQSDYVANVNADALAGALAQPALKNAHIRLHLNTADDSLIFAIFNALKTRKLQMLTINIGFYEQTLVSDVTPWSLLKCWKLVFWQALFKRDTRSWLTYFKQAVS